MHGRLRARPGAVVARRRPGRLQRQAAGARLAAVRGDHGRRDPARPGDRRRGRQPDDQRPGGVHPGQRVHPRRERGPRLLRRGRVLRPRHRRRRRDRPPDGAAGSSTASPSSTSGRWTSAGSGRSLPLARRYTLARTIENYATYYDIHYPNEERQAGRPLRTVADLRRAWPSSARPSARSPAGSARTGSSRTRRRRRRGDSGRAAGRASTGRRRSAPRRSRPGRPPALFDETSFAKIEVAGPGACAFLQRPVRERRRPAGRARSSTPRCSTGAAGSSATSPSPGSADGPVPAS